MAQLARAAPRTAQPSDGPVVAWNNPICDKMIYAAVPVGLQFIDGTANQKSAVAAGTPATVGSPAGRASNLDGSSYFTATRRSTYIPTLIAPHTLLAVFRATNLTNTYPTPISFGEVADGNATSGLSVNTTAANVLSHISDGANQVANSTLVVSTGVFYVAAISVKAAASRIFMLNGKIETNTTALSTAPTTSGLSVGAAYQNSAVWALSTLTGDIALAAAWNRALTQTELRSLYTNPWQLFMQPARRPFIKPGGAAAAFLAAWARRPQIIGGGSYVS